MDVFLIHEQKVHIIPPVLQCLQINE